MCSESHVACCEISIFFTTLRSDAPYRVPYLPTTPAFFVLYGLRGEGGRRSADG